MGNAIINEAKKFAENPGKPETVALRFDCKFPAAMFATELGHANDRQEHRCLKSFVHM